MEASSSGLSLSSSRSSSSWGGGASTPPSPFATAATTLSPSRLDARYSSRPPPMYRSLRSAVVGWHRSGSVAAVNGIKRDLFGSGGGVPSPRGNNGDGGDGDGGGDDMDVAVDDLSGGICAMDVSSLSPMIRAPLRRPSDHPARKEDRTINDGRRARRGEFDRSGSDDRDDE